MVTLEHAPGIDGQLTVDDVFIDPAHSGTPSANDREWRTVAIGAYREGGRGLYALDLTHPDPVQSTERSELRGQDRPRVPSGGRLERGADLHARSSARCRRAAAGPTRWCSGSSPTPTSG